MGQPILVGHHSERGHRAAIRRSDSAMRRSIDEDKKAAHYAGRAEGVGHGGISQDDPEAVQKIKGEINAIQLAIDRAKTANEILRAAAKRLKLPLKPKSRSEKTADDMNKILAEAQTLGLEGSAAAAIVKTYQVQPFHGLGYPTYHLTNLGANKRRLMQRLERLQEEAQHRAKLGPVEDPSAAAEVVVGDVTITENLEENRVQLRFPNKPGDKTKAALKHRGFRWSPTQKAWQRHLNDAGRFSAQHVAKQIAEHGGTRF